MCSNTEKNTMLFNGKYKVPDNTIAILLATYNGQGKYLIEQLKSIEKQTFRNFVCFIHDDGSIDDTEKEIVEFCRQYPDRFVYIGSSRTGGAKNNFMYMLSCVEADYLMFCDQDDVWFSHKIERTFQIMKKIEDEKSYKEMTDVPILIYSDLVVVDENLNNLHSSFYVYSSIDPQKNNLKDLLYNNVVVGCTVMINHSLQKIALAQNVTEKIIMHDWYLALLARCLGEIVFIGEPLVYYRQHGKNVIGVKQRPSLRQRIFKNLLNLQEFFKQKRIFFNKRIQNAEALLLSLNKSNCYFHIVSDFINGQEKTLLRRIIEFYIWDKLFI